LPYIDSLTSLVGMGRRSGTGPQMTLQTVAVLRAMLQAPTHTHYGLRLAGETGLPTGTIYPILARLEKAGWVSSSWEEREPAELERPRRRLYTLTGSGAHSARAALADVHRLLTLAPGQPGVVRPGESPA
jgi:PadR family transcriptional regulator PadR